MHSTTNGVSNGKANGKANLAPPPATKKVSASEFIRGFPRLHPAKVAEKAVAAGYKRITAQRVWNVRNYDKRRRNAVAAGVAKRRSSAPTTSTTPAIASTAKAHRLAMMRLVLDLGVSGARALLDSVTTALEEAVR